MGEQKRFKNAQAFTRACEKYFNSISRMEILCDGAGDALLNDLGEAIKLRRYFEPPSILGLCLYLDIQHSTFLEYSHREDYADTITRAHARIECYLSNEVTTREKSISGVIANLQHNYGWSNKSEIELAPATRDRINLEAMSLTEKMRMLASAAREMKRHGGESFEDDSDDSD